MVPGPRPGQVWVQGRWVWNERDYVWQGGRWQQDRPDYVYRPGPLRSRRAADGAGSTTSGSRASNGKHSHHDHDDHGDGDFRFQPGAGEEKGRC